MTTFNDTLWREGEIKVGKSSYRYCAKVYDEGSEWGINAGRVSKLWISKDGKTVCNYDRGWDIEPKKGSDAEKAMQQVLEMYKG
jgi:hypothetical protein